MSQDRELEKYYEAIKDKKIYLEESIKEYIFKDINKSYNLKENLVNTPLRAEVIVTTDIEKIKKKLNEIIELYEFLIEGDTNIAWRENIPKDRKFINIEEISLCSKK